MVLCSSLYISSDSVTSIFYHTPRLVPLSSRIACPREDGGGDPSFPSLSPPASLVIPYVPLFPLALYPPVHRRAGSRTALPPPLFPFPLQGGKVRMWVHPPASSRIACPREDGGGDPSLPSLSPPASLVIPSVSPLPVGAVHEPPFPLPSFPSPFRGRRLGWGCTLPCPRG